MFKSLLAAAVAAALIAAPAQAKTEKTEKTQKAAKKSAKKSAKKPATKPAKKLSPQQQKMKDCGARWQVHKKEKKVTGQAEYRKFLSGCLKG